MGYPYYLLVVLNRTTGEQARLIKKSDFPFVSPVGTLLHISTDWGFYTEVCGFEHVEHGRPSRSRFLMVLSAHYKQEFVDFPDESAEISPVAFDEEAPEGRSFNDELKGLKELGWEECDFPVTIHGESY